MPGVLLLDVLMPVQNGLQLYEQLLQEGKRLPAIFITAHANVTTAVAAMKTGAMSFSGEALRSYLVSCAAPKSFGAGWPVAPPARRNS